MYTECCSFWPQNAWEVFLAFKSVPLDLQLIIKIVLVTERNVFTFITNHLGVWIDMNHRPVSGRRMGDKEWWRGICGAPVLEVLRVHQSQCSFVNNDFENYIMNSYHTQLSYTFDKAQNIASRTEAEWHTVILKFWVKVLSTIWKLHCSVEYLTPLFLCFALSTLPEAQSASTLKKRQCKWENIGAAIFVFPLKDQRRISNSPWTMSLWNPPQSQMETLAQWNAVRTLCSRF